MVCRVLSHELNAKRLSICFNVLPQGKLCLLVHPFVDGNKRTGFLAAYIFLALNGWDLIAPEADAVAAVLDLAAGKAKEADFSEWLQANTEKISN